MPELLEDADGALLPPELQRDGIIWRTIRDRAVMDPPTRGDLLLVDGICITLAPVLSRLGLISSRLPLIGRDRVVIDKLAGALHQEARRQGDYGPLQEDPRGDHFEVRLASGHIAKVVVTLDRLESDGHS